MDMRKAFLPPASLGNISAATTSIVETSIA